MLIYVYSQPGVYKLYTTTYVHTYSHHCVLQVEVCVNLCVCVHIIVMHLHISKCTGW